MGLSSNPSINEAVALLDKFDPGKLSTLRQIFPELAKELEVGVLAGDAPVESDVLLKKRASIMCSSLGVAENQASQSIERVKKLVSASKRVQLASGIVTLAGSSSVLGAIAMKQEWAAIIGAMLTFLSSAGPLISDYFIKVPNAPAGGLGEILARLLQARAKCRELTVELTLRCELDPDPNALSNLISKGNVVCEEINMWLPDIMLV